MKTAREAYENALDGKQDKAMKAVPGLDNEVDEISRAVLSELSQPAAPGTPDHVMVKNALALAVKMGMALASQPSTSTRRR